MKAPPERRWYLLSYDVSDDKRRLKVAKCLEGYGERIQYSVFRAFLSPRALARLRWELSRKMDSADGLLILHLCPQCQARVQDQRGSRDWRAEAPLGFRLAGQHFKYQEVADAKNDASAGEPPRKTIEKPKRSMSKGKNKNQVT